MKLMNTVLTALTLASTFSGTGYASECSDQKAENESVLIHKSMSVTDQILALQDKLEVTEDVDQRMAIYAAISELYEQKIATIDLINDLNDGSICE